MKRNLLKILPFLLLGGVLGLAAAPAAFEAPGVKAEDSNTIVCDNFADKGKSDGGNGASVSYSYFPITISSNGGYSTGGVLRVYKDKTLTIKSSTYKISKIDFDLDSSYTGGLNNSITLDTPSSTWSEGMTAQTRFNSITVTLSTGDVVLSSLSLDTSNAKTTFTKGQTLDLTGLKVNGNKVGGGTVDVTSQCTFSPAEGTKLDEVGSTTVNITYAGTNTPVTESGEDITTSYSVTVTEGEAKATYRKVTSNTLKAGDKIIFVSDSASAAATKGLYNDKYLGAATIEVNDDTASFADSDNVEVFTVVNGKNSGTYAFKNSNDKYLSVKEQGNDILKFDTNITDAASWTIDLTATANNIVSCIGGTNCYLKYNSNTFRAYKSSSLVPPAYIYKYSSGNKRVVLDCASKDVYENYSTTITAEAVEFEPTLWSWESSNPAYVSVLSGGDSATVTIKGITPGSSNLTVTANGKYKATCVVTCKGAGSLIIEPGQYFITDLSNTYMMGSDLSNIDDVDLSQSGNLYTFEFAGLGDGTYWVSNSKGKYLAFRQNVIPDGKRVSEMTLTDEKVDYWTISKNANNEYKVATDYNGKAKSIAQDGDHDWLAFNGDNFVNLTKQGNLVGFRVTHEPTTKKYYVGESFKTAGLEVMAVYNVDGSEFLANITSKIIWDNLVAGTQVTGTYYSGDDAYIVTVEGLSILGPVEGSMVVEGLKDTYLVGEMPSSTIESVTVTYSDKASGVEQKELTDKEYKVIPDKISSTTEKVVVEMISDPNVKFEKEIAVEHAKYFATPILEIGDKVTLGTTVGAKDGNITGGNEIALVDGSLKSQPFGYLPTPTMEFTVKQGVNSGTYAFEYNGAYLSSNGGSLDFGHVTSITAAHEDDGTWTFNYPYMFEGWDEPFYVTFTEDAVGSNTWSGYGYEFKGGHYQIQGDAIRVGNDMVIDLDVYLPPATSISYQETIECTCEMNGSLVIYLPSEQTINEKNSFICNYVEPQNDFMDPYWEICPVNEPEKHIYFNEDSMSFKVGTNSDYNAMLYRDMSKDFSGGLKSISISIPEDMSTTVTLGGKFNWVGIKVKAVIGNTTKSLPLGAYEVDVPALDTYGEKICTVTYGTGEYKETATFKINVVGNYQPHIKQNTSEVWVDDTNTFTTTEQPPVDQPVTWSSSDPEIANFEDPHVGNLTAYKSGKVTIKVTSYDGYYSDTSDLIVSQRPTGLTLSETEKMIKQGDTFTLVGTVLPSDAKNKVVLWTTSDSDIATVNSKGEVTGLGIGDAIITGQTQGKGTGEEEGYKATCTVHVEEGEVVRVKGVSLSSTEKNIKVGGTATLTAIINPSNATEQGVTWESKYPEIVSVDKNGKITGKKKGTSDVTVTTLDGGFTATCRVTVKENVEPVPVTSISLDITNKKIDINEEFVITATINPIDADDKYIEWTSSDTSIATVSYLSQGKATVKGIGDGVATLTARTNNGKTATCFVTVGTPVVHVSSVSLSKTSAILSLNEELNLVATVNPSDATDKTITWSSSNTGVATVDSNGKVTAVGVGTATITVTTNDGGKTASCTINVSEQPIVHPNKVSIECLAPVMEIGSNQRLTANVSPNDAQDKSVTWSSSNESVLKVDSYGVVSALGVGSATITATTNDGGLTATCMIDVKNTIVHVDSITLDKTSLDLNVNEESTIVATINPIEADNKNLLWTSTNTAVVTVDANGKLKAVGAGEATITATSVDGGKTATCKVTVKNTTDSKKDAVIIVAAVGGGVAAVGIGCGIGIPLGIRAKKRKIFNK